ncbi:MAG: hypothetical protein POELPBGB_01360 [Bacteroidia bacterium]|nr:hypothetical protein [Bacteroidia bacterium]
MKIQTFFFILCSVFYFTKTFGQTTVTHLSATAEYLNPDQAALDSMPLNILRMEERAFTLQITLGNTQNVNKIVVALGSSDGSNDLFYKEFAYGVDGNFQDGTFYHSNGNNVSVGIGNYAGAITYYAEVYAIKENGTRTEGKRYSIQ